MKEFLKVHYDIHVKNQVRYENIDGYQDEQYVYFIIPSRNKEIIYMEQTALAYFLTEHGYRNIATPMMTQSGEWFLPVNEIPYLVTKVEELYASRISSHGAALANFHEYGSYYQYEPEEISSYGKWKELWINKVTAFERKIKEESAEHQNDFYRMVNDVFPYIIGISENAIQYLQESESERRYHQYDQGTISFRRYNQQVEQPVIWFHDFVYDHPSRDLAEYIRYQLLSAGEEGMKRCQQFIEEYQSVRQLSIFSWRILYARLIFPVHLYDCLERAFFHKNFDQHFQEFQQLIEHQSVYEQRLGQIYEVLGVDYKNLGIPVLNWM